MNVAKSRKQPLWDFKREGLDGHLTPDDLVMLDELNEVSTRVRSGGV